jgi:hypothetical protein
MRWSLCEEKKVVRDRLLRSVQLLGNYEFVSNASTCSVSLIVLPEA